MKNEIININCIDYMCQQPDESIDFVLTSPPYDTMRLYKRHGLEKPYTMVENKYPDLKPTTITWHHSTESPGKRRFVGAFIKKGRSEDKMTFQVIRYLDNNVRPCDCPNEGRDELCVAWTYYDDIIKNITPDMIKSAKFGAFWWSDEEVK